MNGNPIKLKDSEINEIKQLQSNIQTTLLKLGTLQIEKMDLDVALENYTNTSKNIKDEWRTLQQTEKELLNKILSNYGEGSLSLVDGTFTPSPKP